MSLSKYWSFTLRDYNDYRCTSIIALVDDTNSCQYVCFGKEMTNFGISILQGFLSFEVPVEYSYVKGLLPCGSNVFVIDTMVTRALAFCKKGNQSKEEWRRFGSRGPSYGLGADVTERGVFDSSGLAPFEPNYFADLTALITGETRYVPLLNAIPTLKPWQKELVNRIQHPAHSRQIDFYVDPEGGKGKTFACSYIMDHNARAQLLQSAPYVDTAFMIDATNLIYLFDIPRGEMENFSYPIIESMKNRLLFSTKHSTVMKRFAVTPHIIVMCNELPDMTLMAPDRYNIYHLS